MDIKYRLESLAETEFKINYDFDYSGLAPEKIRFQLGNEVSPIMDKDQVVVKAKASLVYEDGEVELTTNAVLLRFGLSPIKEVITPKENGTFTTQDTHILDTFVLTTVGVLRGTMMKNLKGTPLDPYFLPLIPMEKFRTNGKG